MSATEWILVILTAVVVLGIIAYLFRRTYCQYVTDQGDRINKKELCTMTCRVIDWSGVESQLIVTVWMPVLWAWGWLFPRVYAEVVHKQGKGEVPLFAGKVRSASARNPKLFEALASFGSRRLQSRVLGCQESAIETSIVDFDPKAAKGLRSKFTPHIEWCEPAVRISYGQDPPVVLTLIIGESGRAQIAKWGYPNKSKDEAQAFCSHLIATARITVDPKGNIEGIDPSAARSKFAELAPRVETRNTWVILDEAPQVAA